MWTCVSEEWSTRETDTVSGAWCLLINAVLTSCGVKETAAGEINKEWRKNELGGLRLLPGYMDPFDCALYR